MTSPLHRIISTGELMARIVVIFSLCLAACDVGQLPGTTPDGGGGSGDAMGSGNGCIAINANPPDGHHNPGMGCIAAGCHLTGQTGTGAPAYSYAGTLYKADKTTALAGASVVVTVGTAAKTVVTANNGNFWLVPGVAGIDPPTNTMTGDTKASGCPDVTPMVGKLTQGGGNCNSAACHATGAQGPIHLP